MYRAGTATKIAKCDEIMQDIKAISEPAYNWLVQIGLQKWTLAYDGGYRYGCMTTNLSESLNSVLKKARALPLKALIHMVFSKCAKYFHDHRNESN